MSWSPSVKRGVVTTAKVGENSIRRCRECGCRCPLGGYDANNRYVCFDCLNQKYCGGVCCPEEEI